MKDYLRKVQLRSRLGWAYLATVIAGIFTALALLLFHPLISKLCTAFGREFCALHWGLVATSGTFLLTLAFSTIWCGLGPWFWVSMTTLTVSSLPLLLDPTQSWATPTLLLVGPLLSVFMSLPSSPGRRLWWHQLLLILLLLAATGGSIYWLFF